MKKVILIFLITMNLNAKIAEDKLKHLYAGAGIYIGCILYGEVTDSDFFNKTNCLYGVLGISIVKEISDSTNKNHNAEINDIIATMAIPIISFTILKF